MGWILRGLIKAGGFTDYDLDRPVVQVVNTWSEWNPGHFHLRQVSEAVKRGVWSAGGFPLEYNTLSLCPGQTLPNRNLLAMETESVFLSEPADAAVFICTCDKDVPAMLMAAARVNIPSIFVLGGAMLPGRWRGEDVVCCSDYQRFDPLRRAGLVGDSEWSQLLECLFPCSGACGPMGTANTDQSIAEALGMALPGAACTPAVMAQLPALAEMSGRVVMELLKEDLRPREIMTMKALENAVRVLMAIGGSTNLVIHLIALARMLDLQLPIERFDELSRDTPYIVNVKPSGRFAAVDFNRAGGVPAVMAEIKSLLNLDAVTVTAKTVGENIAKAEVRDYEVIRPFEKPLWPEGGLAIVKGNLAPDGAVIKQVGARDKSLLKHEGPAVVFNSSGEAYRSLLREDLDVTPEHVLVLRYEGPKGNIMPETGALPIPTRLAKRGVRDIVRVTDSRMSGTTSETIVLHVSPEAYVGGPLAAVQDGDLIELDVPHRRLEIRLTDKEIRRRLEDWKPPEPRYNHKRGPLALWYQSCEQANLGCVYPFM